VDYATLEDYLSNIIDYQELSYLVILDRDEHAVIALGALPAQPWPASDVHPAQVTVGVYDVSNVITVAGQPT
jgi:hypothetical protein